MNLVDLWKEKYASGLVRFDPDHMVIRPASRNGEFLAWGTLLYSGAREVYKSSVKDNSKNVSFDLELMSKMRLGEFGSLVIAANPNSLFEGHLVLYPSEKCEYLHLRNIVDITRLALTHPKQTFIHNMELSAASILDWAHFQAYPITFPIENEPAEILGEHCSIRISRVNRAFPAYALLAESDAPEAISGWLCKVAELLAGTDTPHGKRIPVNYIWRKNRVWVIPRSRNQSHNASSYFGGLEMGGLFCLPNADEFRRYLPDSLRQEIIEASLACEPETQKWFEDKSVGMLLAQS